VAGEGEHKGGGFPTTRHSALFGLKSPHEAERVRSLELVAGTYWRPVYKYVRLRWHKAPAEAEEATQAFFLRSVEKGTFAAYDPSKARFRTFLRVCLDRFLVDLERQGRSKGRDAPVLPLRLDFGTAEGELGASSPTEDPDKLFEAEWVRSLLGTAVERLRARCTERGKLVHFRAFERFHLEPSGDSTPSYAELGAELGLSVFDVTNRLSYVRREFRAIVLELLGELTGSEQELRDEARAVLGVEL
jgi:DNA-directed RNA polymerase specialized sigma24 family protein